ncbi:MAG: hypothetical protein ACYSR8_12435 [Planctomycetota bacterium]
MSQTKQSYRYALVAKHTSSKRSKDPEQSPEQYGRAESKGRYPQLVLLLNS